MKLLLPVDTVAAKEFSADATPVVVEAHAIPDDMEGLDIGPKTVELFCDAVKGAGTVVWNGPMKGPTTNQRFEDAKTLLNYGFSTYALYTAQPDEALPPVTVSLGQRETVQPVTGGIGKLLVQKAQLPSLTKSVTLKDAVMAPVSEGDVLGEMTVSDGSNVLTTIPLVAGESVPRMSWSELLTEFFRMALMAA